MKEVARSVSLLGLRSAFATANDYGSLRLWAGAAIEWAEHADQMIRALKREAQALKARLGEVDRVRRAEEAMVVPDGTGVEWRIGPSGLVQHRYGESCSRGGRPGAWIDTPDVDQIVHPARLKALRELGYLATA